jgi:hypothetical protein
VKYVYKIKTKLKKVALAAAAPRALDQEENKLSYHIYFPPALESENKRIT